MPHFIGDPSCFAYFPPLASRGNTLPHLRTVLPHNMNAPIPPVSHTPFQHSAVHRKAWWPFLTVLLLTLPAVAQEQADAARAEPPERNFQVLKRTEIKRGDHSIIYQQVAPPSAAAPSVPVPPPAASALSAQEIEARQRRAGKQMKVLFFTATVLNRQITELRWFDEAGPHRAFSNIDFQVFSGMGEIETADTIYTLMQALDSGTAEALAERTRAFPQVALLPKDRAAWLPVEGSGAQSTPMMTALDAIHPFYDAHRAELIQAHAQREAASAERERQLRENPPARKNTVISYWRKSGPVPAAPPQNPGAPK